MNTSTLAMAMLTLVRHVDSSALQSELTADCYELLIYRVAQNKIPHRRICNISTTSGLIFKIIEAA